MRRCRICKEPMEEFTSGTQIVLKCKEPHCDAIGPQYVKKYGKWKKKLMKSEIKK